MRNILKLFAVFVLSFTVTNWAIAGFPPVRIGGLLQALKTKFTLLFPNNSVVMKGGVKAYVDTGNKSHLYDGDFEGDSVATEWIVTNATATLVDTERVNGKQHLNLNVSAAIPSLSQDQNVTVGGAFVASCWIKNDQAGVEFCSRVDGVDNVCKPLASDGNWKKYNIQDITATSSTSFGLSVKSIVAITGDIKVDNCSVGFSDKGQFEDYDDMPVGTVIPFSGENIPQGYLVADGDCVAKSDYVALSNVVGEAHGACDSGAGAGSGFNLPDLRGKFIRGVDSGAGNDPERLTRTACNTGGNTGDNVGSCQTDQYKSHTHGIITAYSASIGSNNASTPINRYAPTSPRNDTITGASGGTETRPINVYMIYIIKAVGRESNNNIAQTSLSPDKAGFLTFSFFDMTEGDGWLKADGRCVLKDAYPDYFRNVGTSFGECTITTTNDGMNLPDMRGYFPRVLDDMGTTAGDGGRDPDVRTLGSTQTEQFLSHNHSIGSYFGDGSWNNGGVNGNIAGFAGSFNTGNRGGNETRPDNMALMAYVRMVDRDVVLGRFEQIKSTELIKIKYHSNDGSAVNTGSPFDFLVKVEDNYNLWNGSSFTSPRDTTYEISGLVRISELGSVVQGVWVDGSLRHYCSDNIGGGVVRLFDCGEIKVNAGQVITLRSNGSFNQDTADDNNTHLISITELPDIASIVKNLNDNKNVKCQTKYLSADVTANGSISDLQFDNLVVGRKYIVQGGIMDIAAMPSGDTAGLRFFHDGSPIHASVATSGASASNFTIPLSSASFTASTTTMTVDAISITAPTEIRGDGTKNQTHIEFCELPDNYVETSEF